MHHIKLIFAKLSIISMVGLLLIPGFCLWFTEYADAGLTTDLRAGLERSIDRDTGMSPNERIAAKAKVRPITMSGLCAGAYPQFERLGGSACKQFSEAWQFHQARVLSLFTLILGVTTLLLIAALALVSYFAPRLQVRMFTAGWWSLRAISAIEITVQGVLLVWLSYWLTAYFTHHFIPKLVLIAGVLAAAGIFAAVMAIFRRVPEDNAISGELIGEEQAPQLWARVRQFSASLGTAPPRNLIGGIDDNFFVTQSPIRLQEQTITGRSLFVSLPLLRAVGRDEADAVLAHEMAHFSGGDTEEGAKLGPKLNAYALYMQALGHNALTLLALYVMNLFRVAFELARSRESRIREFAADEKAAALTSPSAIARALIKISAYANYRQTVEQELFAHEQRHEGSLQVAQRVAQGLAAFTQSENFKTAMAHGTVPHPFDSHPPLQQRMERVGAVIASSDFPAIVAESPAQTWIDFIPDASAIEGRLWESYESEFASEHLRTLAFRYEPANDAEREVVLKFFPEVVFALKKQQTLRVTYAGIEAVNERIGWDDVANMHYKEGSFGTADALTITRPDRNMVGRHKQTKIKIAIKGSERVRLKGVLGHYWSRQKVMRRLQAEAAAPVAVQESPGE
jgi:Zn-dependent protease with chaperone function